MFEIHLNWGCRRGRGHVDGAGRRDRPGSGYGYGHEWGHGYGYGDGHGHGHADWYKSDLHFHAFSLSGEAANRRLLVLARLLGAEQKRA